MRKFYSALIALALLASPTIAVADSKIEPTSPVLLTGLFGAGATITAIYPSADASISASFEWFADGAKITSAQSAKLFLSNDLVGKTVSAKVTLKKAGATDLVIDAVGAKIFNSLPTGGGQMGYKGELVDQPGCFLPRPSSVETPTVGWPISFTCQPYNTNFGNTVDQKYSWYRNGQLIEGANQMTYRLQPADAGQSLWGAYQVTYANGFVFADSKKLPTAIPQQQSIAKPTILGSLKLGNVLVARTGDAGKNATLSYQWYSDYAPVAGATAATYTVRSADLGKAVQVLVTAQREQYSPTSVLSAPVADAKLQPVRAIDAYAKIFQSYQPSGTNYDITYITSPNISEATLAREKALMQKAADFWSSEYKPSGVKVVYLTKDDATWAENVVAQNPSWRNYIPGGIRSYIERNSCGFALAFQAEQKNVFIQCVRQGSESSINDQQVGPHEYSHWIQYEQNSQLYLNTVPWLIEGQANFYGLALGMAPDDTKLKFVNHSLAGHATQYDIYNGYKFADFKMLELFERANTFDVQTMLNRGGTVWDQYTIGTLVSEWLVINYGHQKYVDWMKLLLKTKGNTSDAEREANAFAFKSVFGFDYSQLANRITPYFAARAGQLRAAWAEVNKNQITGPTINTTQQLPAFAGKTATINEDQRDWISRRVKDGPIQGITCRAVYSAKTKAKDLALFRLRAKNACEFAKSGLTAIGSSAATAVSVTKTTKAAEVGKIYLSFRG